MNKRTTRVKGVKVTSLAYSSIFNIGDTNFMEPKLDALAVQKEGGISSDKGFELEKYPIFQSEGHFLPINMQIEQHHTHHCPVIDVPVIEISAISSSAIVNLGNVKNVKSKSRIKHIRILKDEENTMEV